MKRLIRGIQFKGIPLLIHTCRIAYQCIQTAMSKLTSIITKPVHPSIQTVPSHLLMETQPLSKSTIKSNKILSNTRRPLTTINKQLLMSSVMSLEWITNHQPSSEDIICHHPHLGARNHIDMVVKKIVTLVVAVAVDQMKKVRIMTLK
jgi:hypothetical protein